MGSRWTKEEKQFLIDNYQFLKFEIIGKKLSRTKIAIKNKVKKLGLKLKKESIKKRYQERNQKYNIDADFFINPKSKNDLLVGYLMGFIWADGYVSKKNNMISVYIVSSDMDDIKYLFAKSGDWRIYHNSVKKGKDLTRISCHCFKLHKFLVENDYKNKSLNSPSLILKEKSNSYKIGFWRGYLDGDGCYHFNPKTRKKSISLSGDQKQDWSSYVCFLKNLNCKFSINRRKKSSYVATCDAKSILKIIDYIFGDTYDGIGLKRKFSKAMEMKKYIYKMIKKNNHLYK